jgi:hypothetical protein
MLSTEPTDVPPNFNTFILLFVLVVFDPLNGRGDYFAATKLQKKGDIEVKTLEMFWIYASISPIYA